MPNKIDEISNISASEFHKHVLSGGKPFIIRGFVDDWPIVKAGKAGALEFFNYLNRFDRGYEVNTVYGPPSINGRIFYNSDMSGLNCRTRPAKLAASLDYLLEHQDDNPTPTLAIQSVSVSQFLPGMQRENVFSLLSEIVEPKIWIGGKATVAAHFDPFENIACCLTGLRRFTLFPPEQIANLYVGPFEHTPAGAVISMVDLDNPDYDKYPNFKLAEQASLQAELTPGDAIYIPYLWWHHVSSLAKVNALMNYWWGGADETYGDPRNALFHAILSVRSLPPHYRNAWHAMFEHYIFETNGNPAEHIVPERRGLLGKLTIENIKKLRNTLATALNRF